MKKEDIPICIWESALKRLCKIRKVSVWRVYISMKQYLNPYTLTVNLTPERRKKLVKDCKITEQTFWRGLKELKEQGIISGCRTHYEFSPEIVRSLRYDEDYAQYENQFDWD